MLEYLNNFGWNHQKNGRSHGQLKNNKQHGTKGHLLTVSDNKKDSCWVAGGAYRSYLVEAELGQSSEFYPCRFKELKSVD